MRRSILIVLLACAVLAVASSEAADRSAHIHLTVADRAEIARLTRLVSIDNVRGLEVWAYASPRQLQALAKAGYVWDEVPEVSDGLPRAACGAGWDTNPSRPWNCYPTWAQYVGFLQYETTQHPAIARLVDLGPTTNTSRPHRLYAVKISDNPDAAEDEPEVLYTSSIHGNEVTGYVLMLHLVDELLTGYGADPEITAMVNGLEIWVNPAANPDGTYYANDGSAEGGIRSLTTSTGSDSGVDGNRNFPDPKDGPHPDGEPYHLETRTMMDFAAAHHFVISANFHGGAEVVNYPWDTWARLHVDNDWFVNVSRAYADLAQADGPSGYMTDLDDGITNGYAWYEVTGGRQDFMNYWHGDREVTIELDYPQTPPSADLPIYWTANRRALHGWLNEALEGVRGVVTSSGGGPLAATVEVVGHDSALDSSYVATDPAAGDYHRLLLPGTYTLRFSAAGHETQTVSNVVVGSGAATRLDVVLQQSVTVAISGTVTTPDGRGAISGASVEIVGSGLAAATTGSDGCYGFAAAYLGTFTFRVSAAGYETVEVERTISPSATVFDFALAPYQTAFSTDLESTNGGLVPSPATGGWEWGTPSGTGNPGAHSGTKVWGTNLDGNYPNDASWTLTLSGVSVPASAPTLTFWHWYQFESSWDGGNVSVSTNGGSTWTVITPDGGYPQSSVNALGGPGYSGSSAAWVEATFDLSAYAGQTVSLRWKMASDGSYNYLGWYLDDLRVAGVTYAADFAWSPALPAPGQSVQLTDRSSGAVQSWSWTFGDGGSSTAQNPTHAWAAAGTYPVTLVATYAGGGSHSHTAQVEVGVLFADGFETGTTSAWGSVSP